MGAAHQERLGARATRSSAARAIGRPGGPASAHRPTDNRRAFRARAAALERRPRATWNVWVETGGRVDRGASGDPGAISWPVRGGDEAANLLLVRHRHRRGRRPAAPRQRFAERLLPVVGEGALPFHHD